MAKTLLLDIETAPNLAYVWGLWDQRVGINQLVKNSEVICYGAKWVGQKKTYFQSVHHDGPEEMVKGIHALLDEADFVVGWNSKGFDVKNLRRTMLLAGLTPPSPWKDIDLMLTARSQFRFPSNKLDFVAGELGVGSKVKHSGFDLWIKCMAGDEKAWREMKKYQIMDVLLLEPLYEKLLPWIPNHPNINVYNDTNGCPTCTSTNFQRRGHAATNTGKYPRFHCQDCGKWFRGRARIDGAEYRA